MTDTSDQCRYCDLEQGLPRRGRKGQPGLAFALVLAIVLLFGGTLLFSARYFHAVSRESSAGNVRAILSDLGSFERGYRSVHHRFTATGSMIRTFSATARGNGYRLRVTAVGQHVSAQASSAAGDRFALFTGRALASEVTSCRAPADLGCSDGSW